VKELEFHLTGVVRERGAMTDFIGPLALILQLLSRNKVEVRDISVSLILEQYLEWLGEMAELDLEVASEFVAMASHLMYIKSKTLLGETEPQELSELISSLERLRAPEVYAQIKSVSEMFADMYFNGAGLIAKTPEILEPDLTYKYSHEPDELIRAFEMILLRTVSPDEIVRAVTRSAPRAIAFPIDVKIEEIIGSLSERGKIDFRETLAACSGRSETVAAFLAVLELCSAGRITIDDELIIMAAPHA